MQKLTCSVTGVTYNVKTSKRPLSANYFATIFVGFSPSCSMYQLYRTAAGVIYAKFDNIG